MQLPGFYLTIIRKYIINLRNRLIPAPDASINQIVWNEIELLATRFDFLLFQLKQQPETEWFEFYN